MMLDKMMYIIISGYNDNDEKKERKSQHMRVR